MTNKRRKKAIQFSIIFEKKCKPIIISTIKKLIKSKK